MALKKAEKNAEPRFGKLLPHHDTESQCQQAFLRVVKYVQQMKSDAIEEPADFEKNCKVSRDD